MIDFLKTLPHGQRVALFTLGNDLRMVAGFTTSTDELIAAAKKIKPGISPFLDTEKDMAADDHLFNQLYSGMSPSSNEGTATNAGGGAGGAPLPAAEVRLGLWLLLGFWSGHRIRPVGAARKVWPR